MDNRKECSCGKSYWPSQAWQHEECRDQVDDGQARGIGASGVREASRQVLRASVKGVVGSTTFDRTAYQRDYMRVWRAVKAGRACLLKS